MAESGENTRTTTTTNNRLYEASGQQQSQLQSASSRNLKANPRVPRTFGSHIHLFKLPLCGRCRVCFLIFLLRLPVVVKGRILGARSEVMAMAMQQVAVASVSGTPWTSSLSSSGRVNNGGRKSVALVQQQRRRLVGVRASNNNEVASQSLTGVVFEPFSEVQDQLVKVDSVQTESLARQRFATACEAAINDQIKYY